MSFEDEDDEGSYQILRERERTKVYLHDYTDEYCSTTEYGGVVLQQRLYMFNWIVEVSLCIQRFETSNLRRSFKRETLSYSDLLKSALRDFGACLMGK